MKLELFELNFSGKHFQTLERETSKFEGQIWKRLPLLHQSDINSTWHMFLVSFAHQRRSKGKRHVLVLKELISITHQLIETFVSELLLPSVHCLLQKGLRGTWFFKGAHLRCATSFRIIGNTIVTIMKEHFSLLSVWQRPRCLKTEHVGNAE